MPFIEYSNGHISRWDDTISVGQLITTSYSGYFILTRIEYLEPKHEVNIISSDTEDKQAPIFHFTKVLTDSGEKSNYIRKSCSAIYCKKVTTTFAEFQYMTEIDQSMFKLTAIKEFL